MEYYATSFPDVNSLNLVQFVSKYSVSKAELRERTQHVIVKTFPNFSPDPKGRNYASYCKYQLIKYKPWHRTLDSLWENQSPSNEAFVGAYHEFLISTHANEVITDCEIELARAELYQEQPSQTDEENQEYTYQDELMYLCQLNPTFRSNEEQSDLGSDSVDWEFAAAQMDPTLLLSCPSWIHSNQAQNTSELQLPTRLIDICSLNKAQRQAYT